MAKITNLSAAQVSTFKFASGLNYVMKSRLEYVPLRSGTVTGTVLL